MIRSEVILAEEKLAELRIEGHSRKENEAWVCNAVSILAQTLIRSLKVFCGESALDAHESDGFCHLRILSPSADSEEKIMLLFQSWLIGMEIIRAQAGSTLSLKIHKTSSD